MPNKDTLPSQQTLMEATVKALQKLGKASVSEIVTEVGSSLELKDEVLNIPSANPNDTRTNFEYQLAWARTALKNEGIVKNPSYGVWELNSTQDSIRLAALSQIKKLSECWNWAVPWFEIEKGFHVGGERFQYANRSRGIFKPEGMDAALSIKTSFVYNEAGKCWHQDQNLGELVSLEGSDGLDLKEKEISNSASLKATIDRQLPLIYFHGIALDWFQPLAPIWVVNLGSNIISLSLEKPERSEIIIPEEIIPSYSMAIHKNRNHQARFSTKVREAYGWKCALSGLPIPKLLMGCHIIPDSEGGEASIKNGISMSTLHHSAFDSNLIGIDPDFKVHVSPALQNQSDGEVLDALKRLNGKKLELPQRPKDRPDKSFLEQRFKVFKSTL